MGSRMEKSLLSLATKEDVRVEDVVFGAQGVYQYKKTFLTYQLGI